MLENKTNSIGYLIHLLSVSCGIILASCSLGEVGLPTATAVFMTAATEPADILIPGEILPFETIENAEYPGTGNPETETKVTLISSPKDVEALGGMVSPEAPGALEKVDFDERLAIIVFQGWKPTGSYGVDIQLVTHRGDTIYI